MLRREPELDGHESKEVLTVKVDGRVLDVLVVETVLLLGVEVGGVHRGLGAGRGEAEEAALSERGLGNRRGPKGRKGESSCRGGEGGG